MLFTPIKIPLPPKECWVCNREFGPKDSYKVSQVDGGVVNVRCVDPPCPEESKESTSQSS